MDTTLFIECRCLADPLAFTIRKTFMPMRERRKDDGRMAGGIC